MKTRSIIILIAIWLIIPVILHYSHPLLIGFCWSLEILLLLILFIIQLIELIQERKKLKRRRIISVIVLSVLLFFSIRMMFLIGLLIEKIDFAIFYNKRMEIVEQVKTKQLNPNVEWNGFLCQLPFEYPIISHSGNDICIYRNDTTQTVEVSFFISRGFLDIPSKFFVYTNDSNMIKKYEMLIKEKPENNWKKQDNWYRILE
ncbi:MAG: hypothetical protein LBO06_06370 [Bacteroidales bacterium]|jgi:hypothetical protein|nr:hypothetical protein [Bacteroidales bacterium]